MAAFGVAAHEVGHAIQHAKSYTLLSFRSAWVPVANLGGGLSMIVIMLAFFLGRCANRNRSLFVLAWSSFVWVYNLIYPNYIARRI